MCFFLILIKILNLHGLTAKYNLKKVSQNNLLKLVVCKMTMFFNYILFLYKIKTLIKIFKHKTQKS